jgi:hypothetical protein
VATVVGTAVAEVVAVEVDGITTEVVVVVVGVGAMVVACGEPSPPAQPVASRATATKAAGNFMVSL